MKFTSDIIKVPFLGYCHNWICEIRLAQYIFFLNNELLWVWIRIGKHNFTFSWYFGSSAYFYFYYFLRNKFVLGNFFSTTLEFSSHFRFLGKNDDILKEKNVFFVINIYHLFYRFNFSLNNLDRLKNIIDKLLHKSASFWKNIW